MDQLLLKLHQPIQFLGKISILFLFTLLFSFCASGDELEIKPNEADKSYWDEVASYLAGVPLDENNRFLPLTSLNYYKNYSRSIDKAWGKITSNYINHVTEWSKEFIPDSHKENTSLYLLSGADFINLYHFYPKSNRYIMVGLETPGYINDPILFKPEELKNAFYTLDASLNQISTQNYFTTILMEKKFANKYFPGVAPVLLVFLKRIGFQIDELQRISITPDGIIKEIKSEEVKDVPDAYQGVRIIFHSKDNPRFRELIFLKFFVSPNSMEPTSVEGKFFSKQKKLNLIMKSAIYLMHMEKYKNFIQSILSKTEIVSEDDSGIPVRYFQKEDWNIDVFGSYTKRLSIRYVPKEANMFKSEKGNIRTESQKFTQEDLKEIYETSAKPLRFKYGYGGAFRGTARNNLILLRRRALLKTKA